MVAFVKGCRLKEISPAVLGEFEQLIPGIRYHSELLFGGIKPSQRETLVDQVTANALDIFTRLRERGLGDLAYAQPLVMAALARLRGGRSSC
jgi:hypothetical protein